MNPKETMDDYDYDAFDDIADNITTETKPEIKNEIKKIPLTLSKKASLLDKMTLLEVVDKGCIKALITSDIVEKEINNKNPAYKYYPTVTEQLVQYDKLYDKKIKAFKVPYHKPSRHKYGRVFPKKSLGLTAFAKKIRNTLIKDTYIDIDIRNAQPTIIYNLCKSNEIPCPTLEKYINNRDEILKEVIDTYDVDRSSAKDLFISLAFLGSFQGWCKELNLDGKKPIPFIIDITDELKKIAYKIKSCNEALYETARKIKETKENKSNIIGSFFALYLQEQETRIMECVIEWLKNKTKIMDFPNTSLKIGTYEFDGIKLLKENVTKYGIDKLTNDLNKVVYDKLGFDVQFDEKPIEKFYDLKFEPYVEKTETKDTNWENGVESDADAAEKLFRLYPHWVYCLENLYVFDNETGMWSTCKILISKIIKSFSDDLRVVITSLGTGEKYLSNKSYGNTASLMEKILPFIKTLCINDNWLKQKQYTSLGKILFDNGYYDFKKEFFYDKEEHGFNPEIVFMGKIHHNFVPFDEEELEYMEDVKQRLFYNALGEEVGNYLITNLARGLAGDMMKRILFGLGDTDCGKSVLANAVNLSCGDYVGSFNAENLAYRKSSNDEAQVMRWALLLRYKRIIFSNEMKSTSTLNGNMIKKISSGGDVLKGRLHCGNEQDFISHFLAFCLANDLPPIVPYDRAVRNRVRVISYNKVFVDEPVDDMELKKDENINKEIKTKLFQRVFIGILIRAYMNYQENGEQEEPEAVIRAKEEWIGNENGCIDTFLEDFEITNDENDFVSSKDLDEWVKERKLGVSSRKLFMELNKYCKGNGKNVIVSRGKKIDGRFKQCWFGIKAVME